MTLVLTSTYPASSVDVRTLPTSALMFVQHYLPSQTVSLAVKHLIVLFRLLNTIVSTITSHEEFAF